MTKFSASFALPLLGLCLLLGGSAWAEDSLPLEGVLRVSLDDEPSYAEIELATDGWNTANFPGVWPVPRERGGFQALWGRFEFQVPLDFSTQGMGLSLGVVYRNDQVFLNGQPIGSTGEIGWGKPLLDPTVRVYPIPEGLLIPGEQNVLSMRVQRSVGEAIEVVGPVTIGPYEQLLQRMRPEERFYRVVRGIDLGVSAVFVLAALILWVLIKERDVLALFVSEVLLFCSPLNLTLANFYEGKGETISLLNRILGVTAGVLSTVALLIYVVLLFRQRMPKWTWVCVAPCVAVLTIRWIFPESFVGPSTALGVGLTIASRTSSMLVLIMMTTVVGIAVYRRKPGSIPVATGLATVIWLAAQYPLDTPWLSPNGLWRWLFPLSMMWIFRFSMLLGAVSSYHSAQRNVNQLSQRVLSAQEQERQRLSRELHDGVAQSLQASRLEAQRLSQKASDASPELAESVQSLAEGLGQATEELRDVSHDLQPTFLFDRTLGESIRWYAEQLSHRVGLRTEVNAPEDRDVPSSMKSHLYRIVQEALTNAFRHGEAKQAWVTLQPLPAGWGLRIEDNGSGFSEGHESSEEQGPSAGQGLLNIRDRAMLLGGMSRIRRREPRGVVVEVDLPLTI
ncbi:MAG: histidine kinase [Lacipirellulaceae bacterium]